MYRRFRPRSTVIVAIIVSILLLSWELFLLWVIFLREGDLPYNAGTWALVVLIGLVLVYRHGTVRADVSESGIMIRNLFRNHELERSEERRVGKECGSRRWAYQSRKKEKQSRCGLDRGGEVRGRCTSEA